MARAKRKKRAPTAKEGGILIDIQYKEGILAVLEGLKEQEEQEKRESVELNALRSWNFFLKKLQIIKRLDRNHGNLEEEEEETYTNQKVSERLNEQDEDEEGYFSVASEDEASDNDTYVPRPTRRSKTRHTISEGDIDEDNFGGGFLNEDATGENGNETEEFAEGGFLPADVTVNFSKETTLEKSPKNDTQEYSDTEGGFFNEPEEAKATQNLHVAPDTNENVGLLSDALPESGIGSETIETIPKRQIYPRILRSRLHSTNTADGAKNVSRALNREAEVINLDSDEPEEQLSEITNFPKPTRNRRSLRSTSQRTQNYSTGSGKYNEDGIDISDEEEELEIEYSDSS